MRHVRMMTSTSTFAGSTPPDGSQRSITSEEVIYETLDTMQERRHALGYGEGSEELYQPLQVAQLEWEDSRIDHDGMIFIGTPSLPPSRCMSPSQALASTDLNAHHRSDDDGSYLTSLHAQGDSSPEVYQSPTTMVGYIGDDDLPALMSQEHPWIPVPPPLGHVSSGAVPLRRVLSAPSIASSLALACLQRPASAPLPLAIRRRDAGRRELQPPVHKAATLMRPAMPLPSRDSKRHSGLVLTNGYGNELSSSGTSSLEAQPALRKPIGHSTEPFPRRGVQRPPALAVYSAQSGLPVLPAQVQRKTRDSGHRETRMLPPRSPFLRLAPGIYNPVRTIEVRKGSWMLLISWQGLLLAPTDCGMVFRARTKAAAARQTPSRLKLLE
jgi:hypothetical protein